MRLVFLGKLADLAGGAEREVPAHDSLNWAALIGRLDSELARALNAETVRVAQNGQVLRDKAALVAAPADEIAFLPPVSGG